MCVGFLLVAACGERQEMTHGFLSATMRGESQGRLPDVGQWESQGPACGFLPLAARGERQVAARDPAA